MDRDDRPSDCEQGLVCGDGHAGIRAKGWIYLQDNGIIVLDIGDDIADSGDSAVLLRKLVNGIV